MKKSILTFALWIVTGLTLSLFSQIIPVNQTFTSDDIINPFPGNEPVYTLKVSCNVQLLSDSSLVRVILIDKNSNQYLIYEAYPLITTSKTFSKSNLCDETCFMNGIIPKSVRIDIVDAIITLDTLYSDTTSIADAGKLQAQAKLRNDSVKIAVMNQRIHESKMHWYAGRTLSTNFSFSQKEILYGHKYNIAGFDYYIDGIFELYHSRYGIPTPSNLNFVDEFDWRYRHDAQITTSHYYNPYGFGWITYPEEQGSCNSCYLFSSVHTVADFFSLYTNQLFNLDLSEEEALACTPDCGNCAVGGYEDCVLDSIIKKGIHKEAVCSTYTAVQPTTPCSIICGSDTTFSLTNYSLTLTTEDNLKQALIQRGPIIVSIPLSTLGHEMELVGFKKIHLGDTIYINALDTNIITSVDSTFIGKTSWILKDSRDSTHFFRFGQASLFYPYGVYLSGPVKKMMNSLVTTVKPICKDADGDGYFWWGIGPLNNDCGCPPGVQADQEDCNDNDPLVGPYVTSVNNPDSLPLYSCSPNKCTKSRDQLVISGDTTWNGIKHLNRDIIINPGGKLNVHGQVYFCPGAKIIVKADAELVLSGSDTINPPRLTSGCNSLWGGIEIWGDPTLSQDTASQGKVTILNGIIENAVCGIQTQNSGYVPDGGGEVPFAGLPTGGIIDATKAVFRNNIVGVEIFPYRHANDPNKSQFTACTFKTTEMLLNNTLPAYGIKLSGVNKVNIMGCTFINTRPENVGYSDRGSGIYAYNAQVTIDSTIFYGKKYKPLFSGLNRGIYALHAPLGTSGISVQKATFQNNCRGIYLSGLQETDPVNLKYNNCMMLYNYGAAQQYGIYLENCSGFKVTQNHLTGNLSAGGQQFGIIVNNSGPENNYIYKNYFANLGAGLQGFNVNRNSDAMIDENVPINIPTGLRFICNKFNNSSGCIDDFLINENYAGHEYLTGIAYNQRNISTDTTSTMNPAGNTFSNCHGSNLSDTLYDIKISSTVSPILYSYHTTSFPTGLRLYPNDISDQTQVTYYPFQSALFIDTLSCPEDFFTEGNATYLREQIKESNLKIDSITNLLLFLIDAGSTDSLKYDVDNSITNQSYEIYQELINASPYLSDTVMASAIEKENVISGAMISDIMVANPQSAKSDKLLTALENRSNQLTDSMWVEILHGMDTVSAIERLTDELSGWIQRRDLYFNTLAEYFINDTGNSIISDSLIALYQSNDRLSSRYLLVQYYLNRYNYTQANNTIQNIPLSFDLNSRKASYYDKCVDLVDILPDLYKDTTGYIIPDSVQTTALEQLADDGSILPGAWARNILIASGLLTYQEPIVFETNYKSSCRDRFYIPGYHKEEPDVILYPNPARDFITIESKWLGSSGSPALLMIYDTKGRQIGKCTLSEHSDHQLIPLQNLSTGIYFFQVVFDNKKTNLKKVVILNNK